MSINQQPIKINFYVGKRLISRANHKEQFVVTSYKLRDYWIDNGNNYSEKFLSDVFFIEGIDFKIIKGEAVFHGQ